MLSAGKERQVLSLAKGIVECSIHDLDADPDLLNVQNGVVDLTTGELYPERLAELGDALVASVGPVQRAWAEA